MKRGFYFKVLVLVALVVGGMLLANLAILAYAHLKGITISSEDDLFSLLAKPENVPAIKGIIGINHLLTFCVSSVAYVTMFYRNQALEWLQFRHFEPVYLLLFPLALFSLYPLMGYVAFWIDKMDLPAFFKDLDEDAFSALSKLLKMETPSDLAANLLLVGILPGIGEELLFRGIIQQEIQNRWLKPQMAIWVTAVLFSLFHFQVAGFIPKLGIGVILGYAFYYSGSLVLPIILHTLNNSLATVSLYAAGGDMTAEEVSGDNIPLSGVILSTAVFAILMYRIRHIYLQKTTLQS